MCWIVRLFRSLNHTSFSGELLLFFIRMAGEFSFIVPSCCRAANLSEDKDERCRREITSAFKVDDEYEDKGYGGV
ncbi:hypothetical protein M8C21_018107 [Ambrosia artemisiifolia]|uniref:Uncharacterized protein n=1 Tax=Ambrosia artemisiifolia TaxID=4212 RepID=A0AAD5CM22_AMBAR|nr:hypothetical protein M8C21_018107 [Ambrosia artemisiifolia]